MSLLATIFGYAAAGPLLAAALFWLLLQRIVAPLTGGRRPFDPLVRAICRACLLCFGIRVRLAGRHRLNSGRAYVFMANHVSIFDPLVLYAAMDRPARGVELEDHFSWPLWGAITRHAGTIPISHRDAVGALASLGRAAAAVRSGTSIIILPEGHRTRDGRLRPFMRGPFRLAIAAGADIVPVVMKNLYERKSVHSRLVSPGTVRVVFGGVLPYERFAGCGEQELRRLVRAAIEELLEPR
jgi:1-acyl-sn-glycerol-3-phosphate acyltransferase